MRTTCPLLKAQQRNRGWKGMIVTNPNCSTIVLTMALAPLKQFGIKLVIAATMQAISGAGYPGVPSMDIVGNVVPFIGGEEEKMQQETQKILGELNDGQIVPLGARVSAHCNRVAVVDGHTGDGFGRTYGKAVAGRRCCTRSNSFAACRRSAICRARRRPVIYMAEQDRPQPGATPSARAAWRFVGRLRPCPVLDYKFVACGHNTIRGAAGAAVLNAELMDSEGLLD